MHLGRHRVIAPITEWVTPTAKEKNDATHNKVFTFNSLEGFRLVRRRVNCAKNIRC